MINHQYKYIFFHVEKTGGTSISLALNSNTIRYPHITALELYELIGPDMYNSYYKFSVVRNPWDAIISIYHYQHAEGDLAQWINSRIDIINRLRAVQFLSIDGKIAVDRILRFENLHNEWDELNKYLNINHGVPIVKLEHHNASVRDRDYTKYYNNESKEMVADIFAEEIAMFGYSF